MNLSQMGSFLVGLDSCSCVRRAEHERREEVKKLGPVGDLIVLMVTTIDGSVCRRPYVSLRFSGVGFPYVHLPFCFGRREDDDERCNSSLLCRCTWSWLNLWRFMECESSIDFFWLDFPTAAGGGELTGAGCRCRRGQRRSL